MKPWHEEHKVDLPEGVSGEWRVKKFKLTKERCDMESLRMTFAGCGDRAPLPGQFTKLTHNGDVVMSDTRAEIADHLEPYREVRRRGGKVLIHGLGLGMFTEMCLKLPNVEHVRVLELERDVIKLVAPTLYERYGNERLKIVKGNALASAWGPHQGITPRYNVVWHDIWPTICGDNWEEMTRLHRRWGRFADWQGSWCRDWVKRLARDA